MNRIPNRREFRIKPKVASKLNRFLSYTHVEICECKNIAISIIEVYKPKDKFERGECKLSTTLYLCTTCLNKLIEMQEKHKLKNTGIDENMVMPRISDKQLKLSSG